MISSHVKSWQNNELLKKHKYAVCHDFVYAVSLAGIPFQAASGPLGQFVRKWTPAARSMTTSESNIRAKYAEENYERHIASIKIKLETVKINLVFDESPDIIGKNSKYFVRVL